MAGGLSSYGLDQGFPGVIIVFVVAVSVFCFLKYWVNAPTGPQLLVVSAQQGTVTFEQFVFDRRTFLPGFPTERRTLGFQDIRAIQTVRFRGDYNIILTTAQGAVVVPEGMIKDKPTTSVALQRIVKAAPDYTNDESASEESVGTRRIVALLLVKLCALLALRNGFHAALNGALTLGHSGIYASILLLLFLPVKAPRLGCSGILGLLLALIAFGGEESPILFFVVLLGAASASSLLILPKTRLGKTLYLTEHLMFMGVSFLALGLIIQGSMVTAWKDGYRFSAWKNLTGRILHASLDLSQDSQGHTTNSALRVQYEYLWNEKKFRGTMVAPGFPPMSSSLMRQRHDQLSRARKDKTTVPVFVNPKDGGESILFPDSPGLMGHLYSMFSWIPLLIGLGLVMSGLQSSTPSSPKPSSAPPSKKTPGPPRPVREEPTSFPLQIPFPMLLGLPVVGGFLSWLLGYILSLLA